MKILYFLVALLLAGCSISNSDNSQSTASTLYIEDKEVSENDDLYITAYNPVEESPKKLVINIEEAMVWNLIQENEIYSAVYSTENGEDWTLDQIQVIGKENAR